MIIPCCSNSTIPAMSGRGRLFLRKYVMEFCGVRVALCLSCLLRVMVAMRRNDDLTNWVAERMPK